MSDICEMFEKLYEKRKKTMKENTSSRPGSSSNGTETAFRQKKYREYFMKEAVYLSGLCTVSICLSENVRFDVSTMACHTSYKAQTSCICLVGRKRLRGETHESRSLGTSAKLDNRTKCFDL